MRLAYSMMSCSYPTPSGQFESCQDHDCKLNESSKLRGRDPNRKISEQDCTKPIVFDGGNLRCK